MKKEHWSKQTYLLKETRCTIIADEESAIQFAISSIQHHREQLEKYIQNHPEFLYSFKPISVSDGPTVVKLMAEAAERANVGPMAAVAGVLADLAVKNMTLNGSRVAVVENGGEISAISNQTIDVALAAGESYLSKRIGFRLKRFPIGIATSSGVYSHAFSYGEAEAVTVFAENAGLADAAATAVGNLISGKDCRRIIELGMHHALEIEGVEGVLIVYKDIVGKAGYIPQMINIQI